jgi:hypothetical protein
VNRAVACSIGASVLLSAAPLAAEGQRTARLEYTRGEGATHCPDEATLRGAVAARLGYDPFRSEAPRTITATIAQRGRVLRADVTLTDAKGKVAGARQLSSKQNDCSELVATMTLAISLAIDPQSQLRLPRADSPPPSPASSSSAPPTPAPSPPTPEPARELPPSPARPPSAPPRALTTATPPASPPADVAPADSPPRLEVHGGLGSFVSIGALPNISLGISAEIGVRSGFLSIAIEGRADLPASAEAAGGGGVRAWLLLMTLAPCYHNGPLLLCALASAGSLQGSGDEIPEPREDTTVFASTGARLGVDLLRVGPFSARVHGDLAVTLTPTSLRLYERDVWRTPPLHVAAGLAGLVRFL